MFQFDDLEVLGKLSEWFYCERGRCVVTERFDVFADTSSDQDIYHISQEHLDKPHFAGLC